MLDMSLLIHKIIKEWRGIVEAITRSAKDVLGDVEVIPFGSVVEGKAVVASDLDILIVAKDLPTSAWSKAQIKSKIEEAAGLPPLHPIQIHLTSWKETETNPIYKEAIARFHQNK